MAKPRMAPRTKLLTITERVCASQETLTIETLVRSDQAHSAHFNGYEAPPASDVSLLIATIQSRSPFGFTLATEIEHIMTRRLPKALLFARRRHRIRVCSAWDQRTVQYSTFCGDLLDSPNIHFQDQKSANVSPPEAFRSVTEQAQVVRTIKDMLLSRFNPFNVVLNVSWDPASQILRFHKIGTQLQPNRHERRLIYYHGH
jgi:hypothetical protein